MAKPNLLVTRRLPPAVTDRLNATYDAVTNTDDYIMSADEVIEKAQGKDALLVTPADKINAALIERLPASIKMIATFSVGYEHIDIAAAKKRGLPVSNTPDVLT